MLEVASERAAGASDAQDVELSIIMPCLNESETLETCLRKARAFLDEYGIRGEIVVGDNGSTDGSQEIARRLGARVVDVPLRGYGAALYFATAATQGRYVIMGDSDDSYDFSALQPFVEKLRAGYDLVMGNRFAGGIKKGAMPWKNRWIGNPVLTGIGRVLFGSSMRDFHCGLRGFSRTAFERMDLRTTGMEYASEMVIKATLTGLRTTEVPTTLSPDGRSRRPHLNPWRDGWRHLRFMLLYSPRWLFLLPGLLMMGIGAVLGAGLVVGPVSIGHLHLGVHSLVYAAMLVTIGFQAVLFAVLSRVFAVHEGLLPPAANTDFWTRRFRLEVGVLVGLGLVGLGLGGSVLAVAQWGATGFGGLNPAQVLRIVVPSATSMALGVQVALSSFFLSVLNLRVRPLAPLPE